MTTQAIEKKDSTTELDDLKKQLAEAARTNTDLTAANKAFATQIEDFQRKTSDLAKLPEYQKQIATLTEEVTKYKTTSESSEKALLEIRKTKLSSMGMSPDIIKDMTGSQLDVLEKGLSGFKPVGPTNGQGLDLGNNPTKPDLSTMSDIDKAKLMLQEARARK